MDFKVGCLYLKDRIERIIRDKFKSIIEGEGLTVPRQIVGYAIDELFCEDAALTPVAPDRIKSVITNTIHSDGGSNGNNDTDDFRSA